jgi:hypothetical protein
MRVRVSDGARLDNLMAFLQATECPFELRTDGELAKTGSSVHARHLSRGLEGLARPWECRSASGADFTGGTRLSATALASTADLDDGCRMRLIRSSGNSEARVLARSITSLAWRVKEPLVANA